MTFRVVRTNQYNQDLGLIHSTNGNHLESPNEGSSIDHQVTIYLHAQNITMFPTNETWSESTVQGEHRGIQISFRRTLDKSTEMASSFTTTALQVNIDSVLGIADNAEMELEQFFDTALVQDNDITGVVSGKNIAITEDRFAGVFGLPTEGLVDISEVPKDIVYDLGTYFKISTCVTLNGSGIQLVVGPQPLWLRNHNFGLTHRIMVKRLATSPHDPLGITDSACKNQLVMVSVQYGPLNTYIPIRSMTIGKSRVARDPIAMHTSRRSNSDIACVTRVSMTFRVVRTNQYNQDLGLIHSTNRNHLESPNEGSSIDHQVTIPLHAQNIIMFPTNETWYFTSQMLVSSSGGLILILTAQSTRNVFRIYSDY
ncbi:hypothetical protein F511_26777 [Dorcoceras hygrometricum]|uniref:Uncharacterized protein n=1 Tax=Dorcoceras hygrometricum TaxID=472368 RepID=A0A2Z7CMC2_9LAMI|nr:hypothetical protein F511_26777 [Dorcoceras hygrometricum]